LRRKTKKAINKFYKRRRLCDGSSHFQSGHLSSEIVQSSPWVNCNWTPAS
jgi:hypothetical protein